MNGGIANAFYRYAGEVYTVTVDKENLPLLMAHKWSITNCSRHVSAPKLYLRRRVYRGGKQIAVIYLHREVANALPGIGVVDHLDGNGLNCVRENLRITTVEDNARWERQIHKYRGRSRN